MPRKPKPQPQQNDAGLDLENDPALEAVELDVEDQSGGDDLIAQANQALAGVTPDRRKEQIKAARKKYQSKKQTARSDDFSTIITTLLTLFLSALNTPSDLKPNDDEVNAFSVPATRMLLRHVPITAKLSADALDVIGMIAAGSAYYARTNQAWKRYNELNAQKKIEALDALHEAEVNQPLYDVSQPLTAGGIL